MKKKSFKSFPKQITDKRRKPLSSEQVDKLNKIFEKDIEQEKKEQPLEKIARKRTPEAGL